jgi:hypothetical protein
MKTHLRIFNISYFINFNSNRKVFWKWLGLVLKIAGEPKHQNWTGNFVETPKYMAKLIVYTVMTKLISDPDKTGSQYFLWL